MEIRRGIKSELYILFYIIGEFVIAVVVVNADLRRVISKKLEINFIMCTGTEKRPRIKKKRGDGSFLTRGLEAHLKRAIGEKLF